MLLSRMVFQFLLLVSLLGGVILVQPAHAQYTSVIEGTVNDQSGASIPQAKIVVTNEATNITYQGISTPTGSFRIPALPSGTYRVEVQADGFKTWIQTGLQLEPNQVRTINPALELGEQKTTVEVTATTTAVETGKSQAANTIETRTVAEAPLFGRNVYTGLAALAPLLTGTGTH